MGDLLPGNGGNERSATDPMPWCATPKWKAGPKDDLLKPANPVLAELFDDAMVRLHIENQFNEIQMNEKHIFVDRYQPNGVANPK